MGLVEWIEELKQGAVKVGSADGGPRIRWDNNGTAMRRSSIQQRKETERSPGSIICKVMGGVRPGRERRQLIAEVGSGPLRELKAFNTHPTTSHSTSEP